ncbi:Fe3+/spermidine/putrescine ABC transporter ATP-binding protein [Pokkaliibacter plantistimulans]|uniref:Fe3+/spermidine/putrescine ABC transporter ATP-binding protein n=1 Tax=Proteobacteria bacterium 228 TaxID=2083153 RepID=A0A2S5KMY6_9PROT|nr:ABC transporter ATP-binding protein [Pokkaliibacter plantistimulans]PPC76023.1 Fe3+/spermidine/putrescine ABC transporter ATP-binding protein [Pokkaliibacter plantistimulans]
MAGQAVSIEQVEVSFQHTPVLQGVDLEIRDGEFVALLGPSGCGKTTLLRTLAGFQPLQRGQLWLGERNISLLPPEQRGTAMVFQSYALWPHMSVAANMGYGLKLRGCKREAITRRVTELLELLGLQGLAERRIDQLSGGQRQRVALGRALAIEPPVLLLDEPLSNLDTHIRLNLRHELRALQQRLGVTAVLVTHDQEEAMAMADRVAVLHQGRVAQYATPEAIFAQPANETVARFMGADNALVLHWQRLGSHQALLGEEANPVCLNWSAEQALPQTAALPEQGPVQLLFRAARARLLLADEPPQAEGLTLPCVLRQASYLGGRYRYSLDCLGQEVLVDDERRLPLSSPVTLWLAIPDVHLFPLTSSASQSATVPVFAASAASVRQVPLASSRPSSLHTERA